MTPPPPPLLSNELSRRTAVMGLRLWVLVGIAIGAAFLLLLALISVHLAAAARRRGPRKPAAAPAQGARPLSPATMTIPPVSKEIQEVAVHVGSLRHYFEMGTAFLKEGGAQQHGDGDSLCGSSVAHGSQRVHIEAGKGRRMVAYADGEVGQAPSDAASSSPAATVGPEVSHLGWGHWYTLRELEEATGAFAPEHVVGEGGYGIVYRAVFADGHQVAVKNLLNNRGQAEREFTVEVEAIGRVRHKNLVRLLGYCAEGAQRILVYEYVDNGNLEQWLHGDVGPVSPLSWDARMNIVLGTAKGITYLHEGLEPKVVHRGIKSSNILLDKRWNPKVSDFGLAKLLGSDSNYVTTRVMGTFGYVAPEYASTGMLNERSDVYSFGVLIMEIISGRSPVDYARPPGEVNLVEWLKKMVSNRDYEAVLDPKLPEKPSSKALKKALLVALRCVDPDSQKRPKMGHAIHMLEVDDFPYREAEREFTVEVEAIGRVRHKNLVRLLGYCAEGAQRILVYEYVDNGNLEQWLHGDVGPVSPLSWDARMNIVLGTAKGITYLHEGLEPKVVHRGIKSSNILLDKRWNPKVSDFGLAKLLGSDSNYVTTRVMGTFGYVAPEYASTGMLNERSDVYSFGVLIMEIISGRSPVDYARPPGEVNLVEWLKKMVSNRDYEAVLDPKLPEKPSSKALKKALLVALRCVDPDSQKRPKMGHAIHMLEVDDFPYREDRRTLRPCQGSPLEKARVPGKPVTESGHSSCYDGNSSTAATTPSRFQEK